MMDDKACKNTIHLTPPRILCAVRSCLGGEIALDPATEANNPTAATRFFTEANDGLSRTWTDRAFVNPPYGQALPRWVAKIHAEAKRGLRIIALLPGSKRTETAYYQEHVWSAELTAVCFVRGRISFLTADGKPQKGNTSDSALYGYNIDPGEFQAALGDLGSCFKVGMAREAQGAKKQDPDACPLEDLDKVKEAADTLRIALLKKRAGEAKQRAARLF